MSVTVSFALRQTRVVAGIVDIVRGDRHTGHFVVIAIFIRYTMFENTRRVKINVAKLVAGVYVRLGRGHRELRRVAFVFVIAVAVPTCVKSD